MTLYEEPRPILMFDSGLGGLSVLREARIHMPYRSFVYVADDAAFPYGDWEEDRLKRHILSLFSSLIERYDPCLCLLACNTASTLVLRDLRRIFPDTPFVGTVPAIKPAAEQTLSGIVAVLATPGTVKRAYTKDLISAYAHQCTVRLVGSNHLAKMAEDYLLGKDIDYEHIRAETAPCFIERGGKYTDIVVLACTHYPFLVNIFRKTAPWPVDWLDPAEAIVRHAASLLAPIVQTQEDMETLPLTSAPDLAYFTSRRADLATVRLLRGFGLNCDW